MSVSVKQLVSLINQTECRDKFMKIHQYQGRMWKHLLTSTNPELADKADIIFSRTEVMPRKYEARQKTVQTL